MIAFYLPGNIPIYTSALLLGLGTTIGLSWTAMLASLQHRRAYVDAGLWSLVGGLVCGRASFVVIYWDYFQLYPRQIGAIYLGGFFWPGALVGSLLALILYTGTSHLTLGEVSDALLPVLALVAACAWLGCWLDGYAYGAPVIAWWGVLARDEWGGLARRVPVQLLGALLSIILLSTLIILTPKFKVPGRAALLGISAMSLELFALSFLRADPVPRWHGLPPDAWISLGLAWVMVFVFFINHFHNK